MTTERHSYPSRRKADRVLIEDREYILSLPERGCGCHPAMPAVRTPDGFVCQGCGVGCAKVTS